MNQAAIAAALTGIGVRIVAGAVVARVVFPAQAKNAGIAIAIGAAATGAGLLLEGRGRPALGYFREISTRAPLQLEAERI